ncbi:MAG: SH3 domain-containing protein [Clostridiales bacterium]|nr:SH3 domain-containing protein [Clostridiales bacterium]
MKKTAYKPFLFLMALALLLPLMGLAQTDDFIVSPPLYLNAGEARPVYQSPDSTTEVMRNLSAGEALSLVSMDEEWAEIIVYNEAGEAVAGWTSSAGIRPITPEDGVRLATVSSPDPYVRLVLRTGARQSAKSQGKYYNGVTAQVLEQPQKGWVKVRVGDLEGYFEEKYLALNAPADSVMSAIPTVSVSNADAPGLNLRSAQSFQSDTKATYSNGRNVQVLGVTEDFVHVLTEDGLTGFMMAWGVSPQPSYADIDGSAMNVPQPEGSLTVIDNPGGQGANLRKKASTASDSLGLYLNGTQVIVTGGGEYWKKVWVEGKIGWMMAQMLMGMMPEEFGN